jgi:hypothetical protein
MMRSASSNDLREAAVRHGQAEPRHGLGELLAVLRHADGARVRADQLDAVLLEDARVVQLEGHVERRLAAHRRQQRVRPLLLDDALDPLRRDRLDVGRVGQLRVRHDRGRVAVHQDDAVALLRSARTACVPE